MHTKQDPKTTRTAAWPRSVSFWLSMFAALALYGLAVLSPKLAIREDLLSEYHAQQVRLLRDEQKLKRLDQVAVSLKHDSRFVEELLRKDLKSKRPGEEIIPLQGNLVYRETDVERGNAPVFASRHAPWFAPVVSVIGESSDIRGVLLLSSVVLILFAFGFLQISDPAGQQAGPGDAKDTHLQVGLMSKWLSRYAQSSEDEERRKMLERLARLESDAGWEQDALPVETIDDEAPSTA